MTEGFEFIVHGTRGSLPAGGPEHVRYGAATTCVEVVLSAAHRVIVDAGSGIVEAARPLGGIAATTFDVLLTHYHVDHLAGLAFFQALYDPGARITFHGPRGSDGRGVRELLETFLAPPWWPVALRDTPSVKRFVDLAPGAAFAIDALEVATAPLHHPQGCTAYRFDGRLGSIVFATDHESGEDGADARLAALARGATTLFHDAQYTPGEYQVRRGWGHSTWQHAVAAARNAGAGSVLLFHHDPRRTDAEVDALVAAARAEFPNVAAASPAVRLRF